MKYGEIRYAKNKKFEEHRKDIMDVRSFEEDDSSYIETLKTVFDAYNAMYQVMGYIPEEVENFLKRSVLGESYVKAVEMTDVYSPGDAPTLEQFKYFVEETLQNYKNFYGYKISADWRKAVGLEEA